MSYPTVYYTTSHNTAKNDFKLIYDPVDVIISFNDAEYYTTCHNDAAYYTTILKQHHYITTLNITQYHMTRPYIAQRYTSTPYTTQHRITS